MICPVCVSPVLGVSMRRTEWLQETRMRRFQEAYDRWSERRLTQEEAGRLLGVTERTFRRYVDRYEEGGLDALRDQRLLQLSCGPSSRTFPYAQDLSLHQFAVAPSSHLWRAVVEDHDAVAASARHARHRRELLLCHRVAADLRVEERKRPREDIVGRGKVESVFNA